MNKIFCNACDKEIAGAQKEGWSQSPNTYGMCSECPANYNQEYHYHQECLTPLYGKKWCPTHLVTAKNDQVIREYISTMWKDVGFEGQVAPDTGKIHSTIGPLTILIEPKYDRTSTNLDAVTLEISGLAEKTRKIKSNIHSHTEAVRQLRGAIVRSLRSSKSAITISKKNLEEKATKIDLIITEVMASLGGVLPDPQPDEDAKKEKE